MIHHVYIVRALNIRPVLCIGHFYSVTRFVFLFFCLALIQLSRSHAAVQPAQIAVVVNDNDPDSIKVAAYYQRKRQLPTENIIHVKLPVKKILSEKEFTRFRQQVYRQTPEDVQFYALAWLQPYRVRCMSITSAMTFGFSRKYCAKGCNATKYSEYYNADTHQPYTDMGIRPSMLLAAGSVRLTKAVIDRGVAADATFPEGTGYLVSTSDKARNARSRRYPVVLEQLSDRVKLKRIETDALRNKPDVLFYFTGKARIEGLETNTYVPGALADHLTSSGGNLIGTRQMSILKWLEAGATASYGTVVEPCSFTQKFPNPGIVIDRYTRGESAIEAYWKSVAWPGQGIFIGEPLAAPFASLMSEHSE